MIHPLAFVVLLVACGGDPLPPTTEPEPAEPSAEAGEPGAGMGNGSVPLDDVDPTVAIHEILERARGAEDPVALYDEARAFAVAALEQNPSHHALRLVAANISMDQLAYTMPQAADAAVLRDEAADHYHALLEAEPDSVPGLTGLGNVHMVAHTPEDHAKAEELFERVLVLQPGDPMVLVRLGEVQHRLERYDAAEANLLAAMAASESAGDGTGVVNAKNLLGRMYMDQGRLDDAERILEESAAGLEELVDKSSYYGCPYQALGSLYKQTGRAEESVEAMKRVAELEPHSADSQMLAAEACREAGDQECAAHYQARAEALRQR